MKLKKYRRLLLYALCLNAVFVLVLYYMISRRVSEPEFTREDLLASDVDISVYLTFVIREFEHFDNAILRTEESIRNVCHKCRILVISERVPYPAINFKDRDIIFVNLAFSPEKSYNFYRVSSLISTRYTIFVPDGAQLIDLQSVKTLLHTFKNSKYVNAFAIQAGATELTCPGLDVNCQKWTLTFTEFDGSEGMCDYVQGEQAILLETDKLDELHMPFELPLSKSLYIQFILKRWKTLIYSQAVFQEKIGFQDPHSQWKHKHLEQDRWSKLLKMIGIKYVLHHIDIQIGTKKEFYYGCTKESERCFGTVLNDMPDFISEGKWTPPCCLKAIRETAHHVFTILHSVRARYWLEGGSLLGAVRHHDIIPWDYDVDVGIYLEDVSKVPGLVKCKEEAFVDEKGFVWEKATEGEFYRVQYSESNRNHVDIFPFYTRNGTMTKNTWFKTHRQDTEFPESFLKPLTLIEFIGMNVSAPNNVKNFLEYKFGNGVIDHPKYPDQMNVY